MARPTELRSNGPDPLPDPRLHLSAQFQRRQQWPFPAHQPAGHLVDRQHRRHRQAALHRFDDPVVIIDVELVPRLDQHDVRAHPLGIGDDGPGLHAVGLGFVAGSDAARWCRPSWAPRRPACRAARADPAAPPRQSRSSDRRRASSGRVLHDARSRVRPIGIAGAAVPSGQSSGLSSSSVSRM